MVYNKNRTYGFYYGDMDETLVRYILEKIIRQRIYTGSDWVGPELVLRHDKLRVSEGVVLTGIGDGNGWDDGRNRFLYVALTSFDDGHLQEACPDIVTVDLTVYDRIKPMTLCQSHQFT